METVVVGADGDDRISINGLLSVVCTLDLPDVREPNNEADAMNLGVTRHLRRCCCLFRWVTSCAVYHPVG